MWLVELGITRVTSMAKPFQEKARERSLHVCEHLCAW